MRKHFPGYYAPSEQDLSDMWRDAIFSLDANVLLHLYRYTPQTRDRLLDILDGLQDRLWLSHQAAAEFHKNRRTIIMQQVEAYDMLEKEITDGFNVLKAKLDAHSRHPAIDTKQLQKSLDNARRRAIAAIRKAKMQHPEAESNELAFERITELFDNKVGDPYKPDDLAKKHAEAKKRYDQGVPPGFKDKGKPEPDRYGDAVVWFQLLDFAASNDKPLIFITDDTKDDWWLEMKGETIGPLPELVQEMALTAQTGFHMYRPDRFMAFAETFLGLDKQPEAIEEVAEVQRQIEAADAFRQAPRWPVPPLTLPYLAGQLPLPMLDVLKALHASPAIMLSRQQQDLYRSVAQLAGGKLAQDQQSLYQLVQRLNMPSFVYTRSITPKTKAALQDLSDALEEQGGDGESGLLDLSDDDDDAGLSDQR